MLQDIVALIDPATCDNVGSPSVCCFDARGGWLKVVERAGTRAASLPDIDVVESVARVSRSIADAGCCCMDYLAKAAV